MSSPIYRGESLENKLLRRSHRDEDGCLIWEGGQAHNGYGLVWDNGKTKRVHREAYKLRVGPIDDETVNHKCEKKLCFEPDHLETMSSAENTLSSTKAPAAKNARKTHCMRGHPFNEENTYTSPQGKRDCKVCRRERLRKHRSK